MKLTVQNKYHWQKFAESFRHFLQYRNQASEVRVQAHHRADPKGQAVSQWIDLECSTTLPRHGSLREAAVDSGACARAKVGASAYLGTRNRASKDKMSNDMSTITSLSFARPITLAIRNATPVPMMPKSHKLQKSVW
jgi:hypothetical protein